MKVIVSILFKALGENEWNAMQRLASSSTNDPASVRVFPGSTPGWLSVEFTVPTEPQYVSVKKIDCAIRSHAGNRQDSVIGFPKTEAEKARARRKAERRNARRRKEK